MPLLLIKNVTKRYDARTIAGVSNINLEIKKAGIYAIQGQSGCGKSTLLKIIKSEIQVDSGQVDTFNNKISCMPNLNEAMNSKKVLDLMLELSLDSLMNLDEEKRINLCREALMLFEITNEMNKKFGDLSSGQQQRVLMAVAFASKPQIMLMDEPFSMIDSLTKRQILEQLKQIAIDQQLVVIWVTHDSQDVFQFADYLYLMDHGKIIEHNQPIKILNHPNTLLAASYFGFNNIFTIVSTNGELHFPWSEKKINSKKFPDGTLIISLRPQFISFSNSTNPNAIKIKFVHLHQFGQYQVIEGILQSTKFYIQTFREFEIKEDLYIDLDYDKIHFIQML